MGVAQKFTTFCSNLRLDQDTISTISARKRRITKRINLDFWGLEDEEYKNSFFVGSYGRDTDIVVSDIDIIVVLPSSVYHKYDKYSSNGQSALLQEVKKSIANTYSQTYMKGDGQVVKIDFSDGMSIEVVPCFLSDKNTYIFPDSNDGGSWKVTNPKPEIQAIKDIDNECNNNLKRLCKMVRAWKHYNSVPMGGLLIDTFSSSFLKNWTNKNQSYLYYDYMTRDFFKYVSNLSQTQEYWSAVGSGQRVFKKGNFFTKAKSAYETSLTAIECEEKGKDYLATLYWKDIYGNKFTE